MRILLAIVAVAAVSLGCSKSKSDPPARSTAEPAAAKIAPAPAPAPAPTPAPTPAAEKGPSVVVAVHKGDGELPKLLAEHAAKAKQAGLKPYVEYTADWCKPCVAFKKYLGDPLMQDALAGTYIVMVDYDAYVADADAMGVVGIPTWIALDDQGNSTGRAITSGVWEEDIPANMARPLKSFFASAQ